MRVILLILFFVSSIGQALPVDEMIHVLESGTPEDKAKVLRSLKDETTLPPKLERAVAKNLLPHFPNPGRRFADRPANISELPQVSAEAAYVLSRLDSVEDPTAKSLILDYIATDTPGPKYTQSSWSADKMKRTDPKRYQDAHLRQEHAHNLSWSQRALMRSLTKTKFDQDALRSALESNFRNSTFIYTKTEAISALAQTGTLTDTFALEAIKFTPPQAQRKIDLGDLILNEAKDHHERTPALEIMAVHQLKHPNLHVRSQAIDLLRSWSVLANPVAIEQLKAMQPELTGYPHNVATEILTNLSLPKHERPEPPKIGDRNRFVRGSLNLDNDRVYLELMDDLFVEAETFEMPEAQKASLREMRRNLWESHSPSRFAPLDQFRWGQRNVNQPASPAPPSKPTTPVPTLTEAIHAPDQAIEPSYLHSMPDFTLYLKDRLGPELIRQIQAGEVSIDVYAGSYDNFARDKKINPELTRRLPSPYAEWGIEKYVDFSGAKPKVHFLIPPIKQYAEHYDIMLRNIGSKDHSVMLNHGDRAEFKQGFEQGVAELYSQIKGGPPEIVSLGYANTIEEMLKTKPEWKVIKYEPLTSTCENCAVRGTYVEFQHSEVGGKVVRMMLVSSDKTLWGEATHFLGDALVRQNPKMTDFWFFGSAGAPGLKSVYGVSVPDYFQTANQASAMVDNIFNINHSTNHVPVSYWHQKNGQWRALHGDEGGRRSKTKLELSGLPPLGITPSMTHTTHGSSFSPAEQTRGQVSDQYSSKGVHTVDVETPLLAELISKWNTENPDRRIFFGARTNRRAREPHPHF